MTCRETRSKIKAYLNHHLSATELRGFLAHVESCPDCYEELETNFMITKVVDYLDKNQMDMADLDLTKALKKDIADREYGLKGRLFRKMLFRISLLLVSAVAVCTALLEYFGLIHLENLL